jgi:hypothetical protein
MLGPECVLGPDWPGKKPEVVEEDAEVEEGWDEDSAAVGASDADAAANEGQLDSTTAGSLPPAAACEGERTTYEYNWEGAGDWNTVLRAAALCKMPAEVIEAARRRLAILYPEPGVGVESSKGIIRNKRSAAAAAACASTVAAATTLLAGSAMNPADDGPEDVLNVEGERIGSGAVPASADAAPLPFAHDLHAGLARAVGGGGGGGRKATTAAPSSTLHKAALTAAATVVAAVPSPRLANPYAAVAAAARAKSVEDASEAIGF